MFGFSMKLVPPCSRRGITIVMEKPISISKEQFQFISSIPNTKESEPLDLRLPVLSNPTGKRSVWYNKKNLQFILDDSVHMKSKLRKKLKDEMRANKSSSLFSLPLLNYLAIKALLFLRSLLTHV